MADFFVVDWDLGCNEKLNHIPSSSVVIVRIHMYMVKVVKDRASMRTKPGFLQVGAFPYGLVLTFGLYIACELYIAL